MKKYNSISDFIMNNKLSLDAESNDGTDVILPIKAIEIYGTVLFADLSNFTKLSNQLSSTGTLFLVNKFINWIVTEGFKDSYGIVDKIIGDEIMIVFSNDLEIAII